MIDINFLITCVFLFLIILVNNKILKNSICKSLSEILIRYNEMLFQETGRIDEKINCFEGRIKKVEQKTEDLERKYFDLKEIKKTI